MIRTKDPLAERELVIDLDGPQGNAFFLLGQASRFAKQLGLDSNKVIEEMKSGDYENLISVFDKFFGDFVVLERS
tara:strand:+ start:8030 stop:8254 length:225 start_codon:yes stop_codon:yes gene_type:complete